MAKWNDGPAPTDRDFLGQFGDYVTRGRMIAGLAVADSMPSDLDANPPLVCWMELPAPRKLKGKAAALKRGEYSEEFERDVWGPYPRKEGTSKANGYKRYLSLSPEDQKKLIAAIPIYARQKAGKDQEFIKHLEFFINGRIFETIGMANGGDAPGASKMDDSAWRRAVGIYLNTNNWNVTLGPEPGSPGCKVPLPILRDAGLA